MKEISIIVTVYNLDKYIIECLSSIKEQNYKYFEVVIVNDGSTDNSKSMIEAFIEGDERFKLLNTKNNGVAEARNLALRTVSNDYLMFVDGDDYLAKDCLSECIHQIGDKDILVFNFFRLKENSILKDTKINGLLDCSDFFAKALESIDLEPNPWGKLYKTNIYNGINFPKGLHYEDYAIFYKLFKNASVAIIDKPLYFYRIRAGSIMRTFNRARIEDKKEILEGMREYLIKNGLYNKYKKQFTRSYLYHFVYVSANVIINSSSSPYEDIIFLKKMTCKKYFKYSYIFSFLGERKMKVLFFLTLLKINNSLAIALKNALRK